VATLNKGNDLVAALSNAPQAADDQQLALLRRLADFNTAQRAALAAEQTRLASKYGAGSLQATAAAARVARAVAERSSIDSVLARRAVSTPTTRPDAHVVYGRVVDAAGAPLSAVTVAAVKATGTRLAETSSTDSGVFELSVPLAKQADAPTGTKESAPIVALSDTSSPPLSFQLELSRPSARPFKVPETFLCVGDRMDYRDLVVPAGTFGGTSDAADISPRPSAG
jgi:hypothetical protein